ncbi:MULTISPECIES: GNAT family N-acetyltransferase [unclassified Thermosynechococcus]|uniref:GNAT family N-acetyltransferase n=1 Tax=unclassified Thermosynechococcus TaxID=2622553 RepID=UPI0026716EC4|nr:MULTISPECIES: GNAT family N-acetyltransferase [unclassified Thermosynechococcus]WKT83759.1 GNAT family N-acetyltransferase [Thermosynechococcus sp. HY596]WNC62890.1 GNAT family N-acetyltransferase [Thermosynechococcus sp. HY591]WNC65448.1 GNAT family N-acetyltransferase [Thermosynechococcus sp. HY593]
MVSELPSTGDLIIRPLAYRDVEVVEQRLCHEGVHDQPFGLPSLAGGLMTSPLHLLQWLTGMSKLRIYVAERDNQVLGVVQVAPFNESRTTWQVQQLAAQEFTEVGTQLLRHCFSTLVEARTWMVEINIDHREALDLYRQNGFQPLAHLTYWQISADQLAELAQGTPCLPNLLKVTNADARLLHELDTMSMPALVRQVFNRHYRDFQTSLLDWLHHGLASWSQQVQVHRAYVFEPQRKVAIASYTLHTSQDGHTPHWLDLTVHPAYTNLYPGVLTHIARLVQAYPPVPLLLSSTDYQGEREAYLESWAEPIRRSLMMSRSVWHKVREVRSPLPEGLTLSEVLQGLQTHRRPQPGQIHTKEGAQAYYREHPSENTSPPEAQS